jgi:hypothetical protein
MTSDKPPAAEPAALAATHQRRAGGKSRATT